jgi:hypothetical protein
MSESYSANLLYTHRAKDSDSWIKSVVSSNYDMLIDESKKIEKKKTTTDIDRLAQELFEKDKKKSKKRVK